MEKIIAEDIKFANRMLYEIQKQRIALGNRIIAKEKDNLISKRTQALFGKLEDIEKDAAKVCEELVASTGLWTDFFFYIKGIGKVTASTLIAEIQDISKFRTVSALWAYFGLSPQYVICECAKNHKMIMSSMKVTCPVMSSEEIESEEAGDIEGGDTIKREFKVCGAPLTLIEKVEGRSPKRKAGHHFLFNTKGRTLAWKIANSFIKSNSPFYRDIYDTEKAKQMNLGLVKLGHAHNRAMRKTVKIFLSHLWEAWRTVEGLEIRTPYVVEKLGHTGYISWADLRAQLAVDIKEPKVQKTKKTKKAA